MLIDEIGSEGRRSAEGRVSQDDEQTGTAQSWRCWSEWKRKIEGQTTWKSKGHSRGGLRTKPILADAPFSRRRGFRAGAKGALIKFLGIHGMSPVQVPSSLPRPLREPQRHSRRSLIDNKVARRARGGMDVSARLGNTPCCFLPGDLAGASGR